MSTPGRKPKPTALKILLGNPGKRPVNESEPQPTKIPPKCPHWLPEEAKRKWKALAPELERLGLLTIVDGDALAAYCSAWAEFRAATEAIKEEGRFVGILGANRLPHPAVAQQRSAWKAIREFAALFGLDPSSRSRIAVPGAGEQVDEFESFLSAKKAEGVGG